MFQQLIDVLVGIVALPWVKFIAAHVVINVVVAIAAALKEKNFQLAKIGEFLAAKLAPYVLVYAAIQTLGDSAGLAGLGTAVFALIEASLLGDLGDSLSRLGVPLPKSLSFLKKPDQPTG